MDTASLKPRFNAPHEPFRTPYIGEKTGRKEAYPSRLQRYVKHTTYNTFSYTEDVVFRNNPSFIYGLQINPSKPVSSVYKRQSLIFLFGIFPATVTNAPRQRAYGRATKSYYKSLKRVIVTLFNDLP
jgi:hypothetical protein